MTRAASPEGDLRLGRGAGIALLVCALALVAGSVAAARWIAAEHVLAAFTTDLANRSDAQRANIVTALARIDGGIVMPGASFSFNQTVGRRCLEEGYERAPGYVDNRVADTTGGGICQLSSTVYNAALLAGLRIDERAPHARRVRSVGLGRDATVVYGRCDLRFTNPYMFPVKLRARAVGERLVVEVTGSRPLPAPVSVRVEEARAAGGVEARTWRRVGDREEMVSADVYPR